MNARRRDLAALATLLPVVVATAFFVLPLLGLLLRAPWSRFLEQAGSPAVLDALWLSLLCSTSAAACSLLLGLPLAVWLAGGQGAVRAVVRVLVTLPMVLPPVVGGIALLVAYGRNGIVGGPLARWLDVALPFTTAGVVLAATYVSTPFFVLTVEAGLRSVDRRYADAAATLGAGPWHTFGRVTLPLVLPSLRAGLVVAWARALGEFGATITFAGNLAGHTRTLPLAVYVALESQPEAAVVTSLLLVVVSVGLLFLLRHRWWPSR
ncbi:MAG: molybdate ABC transporter permease subunit [Planctomycetes bacterium]|nr:molybdate ABC transporter permease subunit [Planctomycetota bacterium]